MTAPVYKLPRPAVDALREQLDAIDWEQTTTATLALPDGAAARVEIIRGRRGDTIVRPADGGSALRIRKFADTIAAADPDRYPPQSAEETARVLAGRNPQ